MDTFTNAGAKLLMPESEPRFKAIFREADLEHGEAIARWTAPIHVFVYSLVCSL